ARAPAALRAYALCRRLAARRLRSTPRRGGQEVRRRTVRVRS
ncbi:MAG: hypothetical protein AVDCRST_MAG01-01-1499, partial [uncultured Rubrobacteraceae bacterium]